MPEANKVEGWEQVKMNGEKDVVWSKMFQDQFIGIFSMKVFQQLKSSLAYRESETYIMNQMGGGGSW